MVRVEICAAATHIPDRVARNAIRLFVTGSATDHLMTARWAPTSQEAGMTDPAFVDSHLAVDSDRTSSARWRECADVLTAGRQRSANEARQHAVALRHGHPGCAMVAVALPTGWLVLAGTDPMPLAVRCTGPHQWVLPSGFYGWSVAGRSLHDIQSVSVVG